MSGAPLKDPRNPSSAVQRKCAVESCKSVRKKSPGVIKFHQFPADPSARKKWLNALQLVEQDAVRHPTVCSLHFSPQMYASHSGRAGMPIVRRKLLRTAFPDILAPAQQMQEVKPIETQTLTSQILNCDQCKKGFRLGHCHSDDQHDLVPVTQMSVEVPTKTVESDQAFWGDDVFQCHFCGKNFSRRKSIYHHLRNVHQKMPHRTTDKPTTARRRHDCPECRKSFSTTGNLNKHRKRHSGEKQHQCDTCGDRFYDGDLLRKHIRKHTGELPYACDSCDRRFALNSSLNMHKLVHRTKSGKVECHQCQKWFSAAFYLQHRILHDHPERYQCQVCQKSFCNVNKLRVHTMIHTDERPIKCPVCSSGFRTEGNFKQHYRLHIRSEENEQNA